MRDRRALALFAVLEVAGASLAWTCSVRPGLASHRTLALPKARSCEEVETALQELETLPTPYLEDQARVILEDLPHWQACPRAIARARAILARSYSAHRALYDGRTLWLQRRASCPSH